MLGCSLNTNPPQVFPCVSRNKFHLISTLTVWKIVTQIHTSAFLIYTNTLERLNEMSVWIKMYLRFPEVFLSLNFHTLWKMRVCRAQTACAQHQSLKKVRLINFSAEEMWAQQQTCDGPRLPCEGRWSDWSNTTKMQSSPKMLHLIALVNFLLFCIFCLINPWEKEHFVQMTLIWGHNN